MKNVHFYSLLGLNTHKHVKCYPTMTKLTGNLNTQFLRLTDPSIHGGRRTRQPGFDSSKLQGFRALCIRVQGLGFRV